MRLKTEHYNQILNEASLLFPLRESIVSIMTGIGLNAAEAMLVGTGKNMWDSVLSLAEKKGELNILLEYMVEQFPQREVLLNALNDLRNGTAFIEKISYDEFLKPRSANAAKTFLVYDMKDITLVKSLKAHLRILEITGTLSLFDMHQDVIASQDREKTRLENLGDADIVLLLLTQSFFANADNNCLPLAFAAFEMRKRVIPVLLSNSLWSRIKELEGIVPLPKNGKFVSQWKNADEALMNIAEGVEEVAQKIKR